MYRQEARNTSSGRLCRQPNRGKPGLDLDAGDDALSMYRSGMTGRPKGALHSHASLSAGGWARSLPQDLPAADRGFRGFRVRPICHINGLCGTMMGSLISGGSLAMILRMKTPGMTATS